MSAVRPRVRVAPARIAQDTGAIMRLLLRVRGHAATVAVLLGALALARAEVPSRELLPDQHRPDETRAAAPAQKPPKAGKDAKNAPPPLVPFLGRLEAARERARARNVPILVHVVLDGETASDEYKKRILPDADVLRAAAAANAIVIVTNNGTHAKKQIDVTVDGVTEKRTVCSAFPMFAQCGEHQITWDEVYRELHGPEGDMRCPQAAVFAPDGTLAAREDTGDVPTPTAIATAVQTVAAKAGPGLSEAQWTEVTKLLESGRALVESKSWPDAWKCFTGVLALAPKGRWADEANAALPKTVEGMKAELERITADLVPGKAVAAYQALTAYAKATAGTPIEKDCVARLKKADADKAIASELAAWRLSVEADALLNEARDAYDAKDAKKGERAVRKLLGKRFAATAAAATARKLWPEIASEEDETSK